MDSHVLRELVTVELLGRVLVRNGGLLHPGETAGFPPDEAADLIARGLAVARVEEGPAAKAPAAAPADKMVGSPQRRDGDAVVRKRR